MSEKGIDPRPHKVNFWEMLRDVLVRSIDKGQFPLAVVALIVLMAIGRMGSEQTAKLLTLVVNLLAKGALAGYAALVIVSFGWFFHIRWLTAMNKKELQRMADERNKLQEGAMGRKTTSTRSK